MRPADREKINSGPNSGHVRELARSFLELSNLRSKGAIINSAPPATQIVASDNKHRSIAPSVQDVCGGLAKEAQVSKWSFFGKVVPERVPVTWGTPLQGAAQSPVGFSFTFRVAIHNSQVVVDVEVTEGTPDLSTLRNAAADCVRTITDLVGYTRGCYLDVEIISAVSQETNDWAVFGIEIPVLASRREDKQIGVLDAQLIKAVGTSIPAQIVLADFREAMGMPVGTGFFCYRAIEAMMQSMKAAPQENDGPAWDRLRGTLCIDRSALDEIKEHADLPRHGKPSVITDAERARVFELADQIIERFLEYLIRGEKALPAEEFSILKGNTPSP